MLAYFGRDIWEHGMCILWKVYVAHTKYLNLQQDGGEISMRMRNGSAHVLRCLKVWYDLPADTFFNAVNIMDRFLTRMKVRHRITIIDFICSEVKCINMLWSYYVTLKFIFKPVVGCSVLSTKRTTRSNTTHRRKRWAVLDLLPSSGVAIGLFSFI